MFGCFPFFSHIPHTFICLLFFLIHIQLPPPFSHTCSVVPPFFSHTFGCLLFLTPFHLSPLFSPPLTFSSLFLFSLTFSFLSLLFSPLPHPFSCVPLLSLLFTRR